MDALESEVGKDAEGNDVTNYFLLKCPQFKHLNFCLNKIGDDCAKTINKVLAQTPDDFGITLAGNSISQTVSNQIQQNVKDLHKQRVNDMRAADPNNAAMMEIEDIGQRRAAF